MPYNKLVEKGSFVRTIIDANHLQGEEPKMVTETLPRRCPRAACRPRTCRAPSPRTACSRCSTLSGASARRG
eukprot:6595766-Prymnesium_polylepis.1